VQPDKSIDVIDEAGARVRIKSDDQAAGPGRTRARHRALNAEKDEAVKRNADYERAAELRDKAESSQEEGRAIQKRVARQDPRRRRRGRRGDHRRGRLAR
jgi:ATP-dependent Clp protease ATP-binding subunit ClpC